MYIVKLNPNLLADNARLQASIDPAKGAGARAAQPATLSGRIHRGHNEAFASVAQGSSGTATVAFEFDILTVSASVFDGFRATLNEVYGGTELDSAVALAAGIRMPPPPTPASRMSDYAVQLFAAQLFDGTVLSDTSLPFGAGNCRSEHCLRMLAALQALEVVTVKFKGELTASSVSTASRRVSAYIPVTAVEFDNGVTIPFAGYSDNVFVDAGPGALPNALAVPAGFWSDAA